MPSCALGDDRCVFDLGRFMRSSSPTTGTVHCVVHVLQVNVHKAIFTWVTLCVFVRGLALSEHVALHATCSLTMVCWHGTMHLCRIAL